MPQSEWSTPMPVSAEALEAWHASPAALSRLIPPWEDVRVESREGSSLTDLRVVLRMGAGPLALRWIARHEALPEGRGFRDVQERGPFASWSHAHLFEPAGPAGSVLTDRVTWSLPGGVLAEAVAGGLVRARLERMFAFRHRRTREDGMRHARLSLPPLRVAISGASGLIGTPLVAFLQGGGHTVHRLVRGKPTPGSEDIAWDPARDTVDATSLEGVDAVIHLAGENVGARWTPSRREAILESRVRGTALLARTMAGLQKRPGVFLSASAVGRYGDTGDTEVDETTEVPPPRLETARGVDYLTAVGAAWECAADPARAAGIRVVHPRIGVVLAADGGALEKMLLPAKLGAGGPIAGGRAWLPWISREDVLGALLHLLATPLEGPVNLVAPGAVRQGEFARELGRVLGRPAFAPLPGAAVRLLFGEMGEATLLAGQRVRPGKLLQSGFEFLHASLEDALRAELGLSEG